MKCWQIWKLAFTVGTHSEVPTKMKTVLHYRQTLWSAYKIENCPSQWAHPVMCLQNLKTVLHYRHTLWSANKTENSPSQWAHTVKWLQNWKLAFTIGTHCEVPAKLKTGLHNRHTLWMYTQTENWPLLIVATLKYLNTHMYYITDLQYGRCESR